MKILRLDLIACGPFTDLSLDLGRGSEGLHLIYGRNEAGKSSALRAIGYFLFGIPDRCEDAFRHTYQQLKIGGALKTGGGRIIEAVRRKGRANTLRGPDDSLLDEALWHEACGRISATDFSNRFGIDHNALVEGGGEIVKGEGELADVLFAAGAGVASFRTIEDQVRDEAGDLFKPGGSKPKINLLLSTLREDQRKLRDLALPNDKWDAHFRAHQAALAESKAIEAELERAGQEKNRLSRITAALPLIGRRKSILIELSGYASAAVLPEGFSESRQKAVQSLRLEEQNAHQAALRIEKLRAESSGLKSTSAVLDFSKEIGELYLRLGTYRKALAERPKFVVQKKALEDQAKELLAELKKDFAFERVEELRLCAGEEVLIRNLGAGREKYAANLENGLENTRRLTSAIAEINENLASVPVPRDISRLRTAIDEAKSCGRIEEELLQIEARILSAEKQSAVDLAGLEFWTGSLDELERLPVPDMETIDDFETAMRKTETEIENQAKELEKLSREIRKIESRVLTLRAGEVPALEDLEDARSRRAAGWKLIRALIEEGKVSGEEREAFLAQAPGAGTLPDAFEKSVLLADELSDRLRREAERVAEYNGLVSAAKALEADRAEGLSKKEQLEQTLEQIERNWTGLWAQCGFSPGPPGRMRRWVAKRSEFVRNRMEIRKLWGEAEYRSNRIEELKSVLTQCLTEFGESVEIGRSLREMVVRAAQTMETEIGKATERDRLKKDLEQKKLEFLRAASQAEKAKADLEEWRTRWANAVSPLGLGAKAIPEQANAILGKLQEIFARLKDSKNLGQRLDELDADCEAFEKQAADLVRLAAPELCAMPAGEAVRNLNELLTNARTEKIRKDDLEKKLNHEEKELAAGLGRIDTLKIQISEMLSEAGCCEIESFPEAERRSAAKRELLAKLEQIDEHLIQLASGMSIEEFSAQALELDPDLLAPLIGQLDEKISSLKDKKSALDQAIGAEKTELARWDGRGDAAELAQKLQAGLADLESSARQYSRLRLAHALLTKAKERHREMSQGPVIKRTSELFCALTGGSFEGIRAGDDSGKNVIVGLRRGGEIVPARAMSEGTADQLYLALRLASFEHYAANNEPLPLVLDDILVHFDDHRAKAALSVLSEVSKKTQLIMFTHHRHLVDLAQSELAGRDLFVLELQ